VSAGTWAAVGLLGGAGAVLRHLVDAAVSASAGTRLPWGILAVNVSGAFALGLLGTAHPAVSVGLLGAFTTFSTWMLQTQVLLHGGRRRAAVVYVAGSLVLGLLAVWAGRGLA
jgi:CrcB protein